jgi:ATP-binding cassette subfamily F protein 3
MAAREARQEAAKPAAETRRAEPDAKRKRKFPYRKVAELEADIATAEAQVAELQEALTRPEVLRDGQRAREVHRDFEMAQTWLAQLYEHWEEACELN